jgi:hypothetical protein
MRAESVRLKERMRGEDITAHAEKCDLSSVALARLPTGNDENEREMKKEAIMMVTMKEALVVSVAISWQYW